MRKIIVAIAMMLALNGCAAGLSALQSGGLSGTAAGLFGIPAATVATQLTAEIVEIQAVAMQLQMLRAQLNGTPIVVPPLPAPAVAR